MHWILFHWWWNAVMSESRVNYRCEGFYPLQASDIRHAAMLFALWKARQKFGPNAECCKLDVQGDWQCDAATFEAFIGIPPQGELYRFTVMVDVSQ
jgi:hypothetical protein